METFPLQKGSKGEKVRRLQRHLNMSAELIGMWPDRLAEDGDFGEATKKLLYKTANLTQVTEADWAKLEKAYPYTEQRLAEARRTKGQTIDNILRKTIDNEAAIFHWLLRTYGAWDKMSVERRKQFQPAFDAAFNIAVRQRQRVAKYNQASRDILWQKGWYSPEYGPLVKKYVEGKAVFGVGTPLVIAASPGLIAAVAIGALIIGALATVAVVNWLTPAYSESTVDFKKTREIQDILDKLPKEDQVKLEAEVEQQIDKAYVTGKRDGKLGGGLNVMKAGGIALLLLFAYEKFGRPGLNSHYRK